MVAPAMRNSFRLVISSVPLPNGSRLSCGALMNE
jgi:hypothetical protein